VDLVVLAFEQAMDAVATAYADGVRKSIATTVPPKCNKSGTPKQSIHNSLIVGQMFDTVLEATVAPGVDRQHLQSADAIATALWAVCGLNVPGLEHGAETRVYMPGHVTLKYAPASTASGYVAQMVATNELHPQTVSVVQWCAYRRWRAMVCGELLALLAPGTLLKKSARLALGEKFLVDLFGGAVIRHNDRAPLSMHVAQGDEGLLDAVETVWLKPELAVMHEYMLDHTVPVLLKHRQGMAAALEVYVQGRVSVSGLLATNGERSGRRPTLDVTPDTLRTTVYTVRSYLQDRAEHMGSGRMGPLKTLPRQRAAMRCALRLYDAGCNPLTAPKVAPYARMLAKINEVNPDWPEACREALRGE
jgi:hypothetical protein